ncbi:MAG: ribosomal-protein-alanine N-acetyltransferase [Ilumatobacter sp.]|jgi:ribosomal-protein-alanine N-acetyltransferase
MPRTVDPVISTGSFRAHPQPELNVDSTLRLRPFGPGDAASVTSAFADPDIQHWHGFRIDDADEASAWIERTHARWSSEEGVDWAIVRPSEDAVLGRIALHVNFWRGHAEVAYWVLPGARRQGLATRAVERVTRWGHEWLGANRILLQHSVSNIASCAVALCSGYEIEGTARSQDLHADGWHDMHQHAHLAAPAVELPG